MQTKNTGFSSSGGSKRPGGRHGGGKWFRPVLWGFLLVHGVNTVIGLHFFAGSGSAGWLWAAVATAFMAGVNCGVLIRDSYRRAAGR